MTTLPIDRSPDQALDQSLGPAHVDETGAACPHHLAASRDGLLQLAMVGSRASSFHHDCASKLQGLVMALDEINELTMHGDPQLTRAVEIALDSTRELHGLLNANRALTKPPARAPIALRDLLARASAHVRVALQGEVPDVMVQVAVAPVSHALALALDVAAGVGRSRALAITSAVVEGAVELVMFAATPPPANASEALAIATFVITRDGGRMWCSAAGDRLVVRLPCA